MKSRKKATFLVVFLLIFSFVIPVNALNSTVTLETNTTDEYSVNQERITTKYADGTIQEEVFVYNNATTLASNTQVSLKPYLPEEAVPYNTGISTLSIDPTDRVQVNPADSRIGYLQCGFDSDGDNKIDRYYYGTASLQSHDILISAAHCVWKGEYAAFESEGWAKSIQFYAGRNGTNTYRAIANFTKTAISTNYVNNGKNGIYDSQNDWTIITIDQDLGSTCGWLGLHGCSEVELNYTVETIGYPSDKGSYYQWKSNGIIDTIDNYIMNFSAYVYPGNSGGPIIINMRRILFIYEYE